MAQTDPLARFRRRAAERGRRTDERRACPPRSAPPAPWAVYFSGKIARSAESHQCAGAHHARGSRHAQRRSHAWCRACTSTSPFSLPPRGSVEVPAAALIFRASGTQVAQVDVERQDSVSATSSIARDNGSLVELASGVKPGRPVGAEHQQSNCRGPNGGRQRAGRRQTAVGAKR